MFAAALIIFRDENAADFGSADVAWLTQITAQIPAAMLAELLLWPQPAPAAPASALTEPMVPAVQRSEQPQLAEPFPRQMPPPVTAERSASISEAPKIVTIAPGQSLAMDERIRHALREGGFDLYAQRIAPLRDAQRADRFEILLRMRDGDTLRMPQAFFAAAEASELMPDLDHWVVRQLMAMLRKRATTLRTTCWEFSVNIAAQTLLTDRFSEYVVEEIKRSSIPAGLLVFEISEGDAIEHQYSLSILTKRLHNVGCRIALDNCSAGLRTFETIRKWPISCMKIDGSLVRNVVSNCRYESQVRAVAKMANDLGIETVAECVENELIREKILGMEIDYAQGFHVGRPEPLVMLFR